MVGPGKPIDTDRFHVICANVIGGCMGSTGPASPTPGRQQPCGMRFPVITIRDMVRAQVALLDALGIGKAPRRGRRLDGRDAGAEPRRQLPGPCRRACWRSPPPRAIRRRTSPSTRSAGRRSWPIRTGRAAIITRNGKAPDTGLAVARMAAHITYLSEAGLTEKFGRRLQDREAKSFGFDADFQVESYLRHQGISFTGRFDANSYLYITRAMDYFDLAEEHGGRLADAFAGTRRRASASSASIPTGSTPRRNRAASSMRSTRRGRRSASSNCPRRTGMTASCWTFPALDRVIKGFLE